MGGILKKPKVPQAAEPKVVPMPDVQTVETEERRRSARQLASRRGRQSTILTSGETLGGG